MSDAAAAGKDRLLSTGLLAGAVVIALSPVFAELVGYLTAIEGNFAILIAPILLGLAIRLCPSSQPRRPTLAVGLIGLAVALQFAGILLASWTIARVALPFAALGLAAWAGTPSARHMALLFWLVPVPTSLLRMTTPWLESGFAAIAHALVTGLGADVDVSGPLLRSGGGTLELHASNNGFWLMFVLAEVAWYRGVLRDTPARPFVMRTLALTLLGLPLQLVATVLATVLLVAGLEAVARAWLDWGLSYGVAGSVVLMSWPRGSTTSR